MTEKVLFGFSGGKDSCLALNQILKDPQFEVVALLTTLTEDYKRISMHGVRETLLDQQAQSIGLPLEKVWIPKQASNEIYQNRMRDMLEKYKNIGINQVVFGDIFLEDVRAYREKQLTEVNMEGIFPLWGQATSELANKFVNLGFKAITCCVDNQSLDETFVGRELDAEFFSSLPKDIDPCGENGEFHSYVYDGPIFKKLISITISEAVLRDNRFYFCELLPGEKNE